MTNELLRAVRMQRDNRVPSEKLDRASRREGSMTRIAADLFQRRADLLISEFGDVQLLFHTKLLLDAILIISAKGSVVSRSLLGDFFP